MERQVERFTFVSRTLSARNHSHPHDGRSFIHDHSLLLNETRHLRPVRYKLWFFHMERACVIVFPLSLPYFIHDVRILVQSRGREREGRKDAARFANTWGWKPVSRNRLSREAQKKHADRDRNSISRGDNAFHSRISPLLFEFGNTKEGRV